MSLRSTLNVTVNGSLNTAWNGLYEGMKLCMLVNLATKSHGVTGIILKMQAGIMQSWSNLWIINYLKV